MLTARLRKLKNKLENLENTLKRLAKQIKKQKGKKIEKPPKAQGGGHVKGKEPKKSVTKKKKYPRSKSERRKALLRDANDPNSGLSQEARDFIKKTDGYKVPPNYEVSHEIPLNQGKTFEEKAALDVESNMKTMPKTEHRARHMVCGDQYHAFGP